jgi:hypothetical protein
VNPDMDTLHSGSCLNLTGTSIDACICLRVIASAFKDHREQDQDHNVISIQTAFISEDYFCKSWNRNRHDKI